METGPLFTVSFEGLVKWQLNVTVPMSTTLNLCLLQLKAKVQMLAGCRIYLIKLNVMVQTGTGDNLNCTCLPKKV